MRNDTKLLFRNDPVADLTVLTSGKKLLFVYGGESAKKNGCYNDVKKAVENAGGIFYELADALRELEVIEKGIRLVKENGIRHGGDFSLMTKKLWDGCFHIEINLKGWLS